MERLIATDPATGRIEHAHIYFDPYSVDVVPDITIDYGNLLINIGGPALDTSIAGNITYEAIVPSRDTGIFSISVDSIKSVADRGVTFDPQKNYQRLKEWIDSPEAVVYHVLIGGIMHVSYRQESVYTQLPVIQVEVTDLSFDEKSGPGDYQVPLLKLTALRTMCPSEDISITKLPSVSLEASHPVRSGADT